MKVSPIFVNEPWGRIIWLLDDRNAPAPGMTLARMEVEPGQTSPLHRHGNCREAIHLLSGEIDQIIGDKVIAMRPGDTALIPEGIAHQTRNRGSALAVMMLSYSSGSRAYEALSALV
jgi:quercetin dioxygenase-like cupin family protein